MTTPEWPSVLLNRFDGGQGAIRSIIYNIDGGYCITCGSDKTLKLWRPDKSLLLQTYTGHGSEPLSAASSLDNSKIVSGGSDKIVCVWDVTTAKTIKRYRGHVGRVNSVACNEDATIVASGAFDGSVQLWDTRSNSPKALQILKEAKDSVTCVRITESEILSSSLDTAVRVYDIRKGMMVEDRLGFGVTCVNVTRDKGCYLASCLGTSLKLMDKERGGCLAEFEGHRNSEFHVESCISSGDKHVLSGSEDSTVYIWDLIRGNVVDTLKHRVPVVNSLSYHPTKTKVISSAGGYIYEWGTSTEPEAKKLKT